jgi:hypothetical protein
VTARCTKAIEQLGSDRLDVRVGGIYALERIAHDSPRDHLAVLEVLAAFIREQRSRAMVTERARRGDARAGNAARCTGCGRRNWAPNPQARPGVSLARANPAPRTSPAHPGARMRQFPGLATAPTRAAGSRPILARAVRQPTCYALTGLPYLLSGICTGASSRHGMAGGAPGSATRARSVGSCRGECQAARQPCAWQDTTRCPGPRVRAASAGVHSHGIHDTIPRPRPHSWPFAHSGRQHHQAGRRTSTTRWKHLSDQGRASVPFCLAWIDRAGPARRAAQVSAQDVDIGLPPHGGRRARLGIISGCPQIVPVSPRCPPAKCPPRWHQSRSRCWSNSAAGTHEAEAGTARTGGTAASAATGAPASAAATAAGTPAAAAAIAAAGTGTGPGASTAPRAAPEPLPEALPAAPDAFGCSLIAERCRSRHTARAYLGDARSLPDHVPPRRCTDPARW